MGTATEDAATQAKITSLVATARAAKRRVEKAERARKTAAQDRALAALDLYELIGRAKAAAALGEKPNRLDNLVADGRLVRAERDLAARGPTLLPG